MGQLWGSYSGRDDMLALTHSVVTSLRFHSPNGRQPARHYQIFCTFIIMPWVGLEEKMHSLQPEVPAERMYLPFTGFAFLLCREGCQHKVLAGLVGHSQSNRLDTREGVKPHVYRTELGQTTDFVPRPSLLDFTIELLLSIDPYP